MTNEKKIRNNIAIVRYTGTEEEQKLSVPFKPVLIKAFDENGNGWIWTNNKTFYDSTSLFSSKISRYELTSDGVSLDLINGKVVIGSSAYVNKDGAEYTMMAFAGDD